MVEGATDEEVYQFTANWQEADGADKYLLYVATDPSFDAPFILSDYNGREVLGSSHVVSGLDPYVTYYYRLRSKQAAATSDVSTYATVEACISESCRLLSRTFAGEHRERYRYNSNQRVDRITLIDISSTATLRESIISYDDDRISTVDETNTTGDNRRWTFAYENTGSSQQRIKNILIENTTATADVIKITFTYNGSGRLVEAVRRSGSISGTDTTFTVVGEENYAYNTGGEIHRVRNGTGTLVKEIVHSNEFNTESLLSADLALLLFNPTDPGEFLLPIIPKVAIEFYQYRSGTTDPWNSYPYSYEHNGKQVPRKVRATNGVPELTYQFSGCDF